MEVRGRVSYLSSREALTLATGRGTRTATSATEPPSTMARTSTNGKALLTRPTTATTSTSTTSFNKTEGGRLSAHQGAGTTTLLST